MQEKIVIEYLRDTSGLPFVWGAVDCMTWAAGLVFEATGIDPASWVRETYDNRTSAARVIAANGGLWSCAERCLEGILVRDDAAQFGVCLVDDEKLGICAGVMSAGRPILKTDGGAVLSSAAVLAVWRV